MIKKIESKDIPGRKNSRNEDVMRDVMEFVNSGWVACEVNTEKYKRVTSAFSSYKAAIKRLCVGVEAFTRVGRLFLVRTEAEPNE